MTHANAVLIALSLSLCTIPPNGAVAATPACHENSGANSEQVRHDLRLRLAGRRGEENSSSRQAVAEVLTQLTCAGDAQSYKAGHALALSLMDAEQAWERDEIAARTLDKWWDDISFNRDSLETTVPDDIEKAAMFVAWSDMANPQMRGASTRALIFLARAISPDHTIDLLDYQAYLKGGDSSPHDRQQSKFTGWQVMRFLWVSNRFGQNVEAGYTASQLKAFEKTLMSSLALPEALKGLELN